jgi:hypothetical protein
MPAPVGPPKRAANASIAAEDAANNNASHSFLVNDAPSIGFTTCRAELSSPFAALKRAALRYGRLNVARPGTGPPTAKRMYCLPSSIYVIGVPVAGLGRSTDPTSLPVVLS